VQVLERYDELDMARGIAILMMIIFHVLFDLYFFGIYPVAVTTGFWRYFAFSTASLFLLIAGVSLTLSHARIMQKDPPPPPAAIWKKYLKRGGFIFGCGLLVTLATYIYLGNGFVLFGILHVIGVSIMVSPLFFRFKEKNIVIGAMVVLAGIVIAAVPVSGPAFLIPVGIHPSSFYSVDYEPVVPWSGIVLIGLGLGNLLYLDGRRAFPVPALPRIIARPLTFLGRHSLIIYLIHQPVILLVLQAVTGARIFF
jgi:uncharacterized membrane protein